MYVQEPNSVDNDINEALLNASAPPLPGSFEEEIAPQESAKSKFEWNTERLFAHNSSHSAARTWAVRLLSLIVGIPTLILDLGRRLAFTCNLIDGKSFSLIDAASKDIQTVAEKVNKLFASKTLTIEDQNSLSVEKIQSHAKKLVEGFEKLNGGRFHTNCSFSSPYALEGTAQIDKATDDLIADVQAYVARNADSAEHFSEQLNIARRIVYQAIHDASKGKYFVPVKTVYSTVPMFDAATKTFDAALAAADNSMLREKLLDGSSRSSDFASALRKGIDGALFTKEQAHAAIQKQAKKVYSEGLETGIDEAEESISCLLESAIRKDLISREEAIVIDRQIQPDVEVLAVAAAKDVVREKTPACYVSNRLIDISRDLQDSKRLKSEDISYFLTSAQECAAKAKEEISAIEFEEQEEVARIAAERAAELQRVSDQQSLFGRFTGMLNLIAKKQSDLTAQFATYDQLETDLTQARQEFEAIRREKVTINGQEVSILQAADSYFATFAKISKLKTAAERQKQLDALSDEGFTKATIARIEETNSLKMKLEDVIKRQATLAGEIESQYDDLARLRSIYKVFRNNNFTQLETENRNSVVDQEVQINKTQKSLKERLDRILGHTGIKARLRSDRTSALINMDPQGNRNEVEALLYGKVEEVQAPVVVTQSAPVEEKKEVAEEAVTYPSFSKRLSDAMNVVLW